MLMLCNRMQCFFEFYDASHFHRDFQCTWLHYLDVRHDGLDSNSAMALYDGVYVQAIIGSRRQLARRMK